MKIGSPGRARAGCLALFAAAPLMLASPACADTEVKIHNFTFAPQTLTIKAGTKVTWTNEDDIPHTVASTSKAFKSSALDGNDSYSYTFTTPGSFEYICSLHPHKTGKIVVEGS
jgi:plastocyanin